MKPIHLCVSALLVALAPAANLAGQDNPSRLVARGQTALRVDQSEALHRPADNAGFPAFSPGRERGSSAKDDTPGENVGGDLAGPAITMASSLVVVLGLFAGLVWMTRRFGSRGMSSGAIPKEVVQCLGSAPIDARTSITMVRCGNRILVMARTATTIHPLAEITDPDEVRELSATCLGDSKRAFTSALRSIEKETTEPGYAGAPKGPATRPGGSRLFASA